VPALTCFFTRSLVLLSVTGFLVVTTPSAYAHGDDQVLIDALTEELAKAPEADLFIRRGELFRHHQEWTKADADFVAAARLEPKLTIVDFFRARLMLESGAPEKARPLVDRYIANAPDEAEGRFLRGDILAALDKHDAGALEYTEGIRRAPSPRPEHYLRRAKFLAAAPAADPARVLAALDEGIARVGPIVSLVDYAITLELERKNYDAALARIATIMEHSPRRETWLVRRGDVLVKCGRTREAVASYRAALTAIEQLPPRYRETVPMEKLARDARTSLGQLSAQ
jgi:predicted negative regulator of RcsB-dependent stress response